MAAKSTVLVLTALAVYASSVNFVSANQKQDLVVAVSEMQKANYFTFVMLLNMIAPFDETLLRLNLTFLMPNDRTLSKLALRQDDVADFVLRHSIPSALLFDHLQRIPTGSIIQSSKPEYSLKVFNNGRRNFFLNNAKLISPNICTAGSAIRCHGIDRALLEADNPAVTQKNATSLSCFRPASPAVPLSPAPSPPINDVNTTPATVPSQNSGAPGSFSGRISTFWMSYVVLSLWIIHL